MPLTLDFAARSLSAFTSLYKNGKFELEGVIGNPEDTALVNLTIASCSNVCFAAGE